MSTRKIINFPNLFWIGELTGIILAYYFLLFTHKTEKMIKKRKVVSGKIQK